MARKFSKDGDFSPKNKCLKPDFKHMEKITLKKIKKVSDLIAKKYKPEKIILFGSFAWGKPKADSDVDLFVIKKSKKLRRERQRELRMKLFPPGMPLDLLVYSPDEIKERLKMGDFFIREIIDEGKVLYEAKK